MGWAGLARKGDQRSQSYICPRPLPHAPPPPPDHRRQKRLSQPKVAFHFLRLNVEGGRRVRGGGGTVPAPVWVGAGQIPDWHSPEIKESGLKSLSNKSWTPLAPAQEWAPPSPQTSQETCQVGIFSPNTYPQNRKARKGNDMLMKRCPVEGQQKSGHHPPGLPQPGLAREEFPSPPERPRPRVVRAQCRC